LKAERKANGLTLYKIRPAKIRKGKIGKSLQGT